jgi:hypothetical protein
MAATQSWKPLILKGVIRSPSGTPLSFQAAQASGAEVLYSEDLSDGQKYGAVRVTNPLREIE